MRRWWLGTDLLPNIPEKIFTPELTLEEAVERICRDIALEA